VNGWSIYKKMWSAMSIPLTLLQSGFLRWPRHVTRLDSRRHREMTRYVLRAEMDRRDGNNLKVRIDDM
jgi:hypothetical protein